MTSYFEYRARTPQCDLIEPDDTLIDTGVHVQHGEVSHEEWQSLLEAAYEKAVGPKP